MPEQEQEQSGQEQQSSLWLGQVRAALRPFHLDPVEVREVLLASALAGQDPVSLYLSVVRERPEEYEQAPPLQKVLPQSVLDKFLGERESSLPESSPSSEPAPPLPQPPQPA